MGPFDKQRRLSRGGRPRRNSIAKSQISPLINANNSGDEEDIMADEYEDGANRNLEERERIRLKTQNKR